MKCLGGLSFIFSLDFEQVKCQILLLVNLLHENGIHGQLQKDIKQRSELLWVFWSPLSNGKLKDE